MQRAYTRRVLDLACASQNFPQFDKKMFRKVNPNVKHSNQISLSRTSYFVRFLLKIWFFPVYVEGDKIVFRLFSCKTFIHITLSFGFFTTFLVIAYISSGFTEVLMSIWSSVSCRPIQLFIKKKIWLYF